LLVFLTASGSLLRLLNPGHPLTGNSSPRGFDVAAEDRKVLREGEPDKLGVLGMAYLPQGFPPIASIVASRLSMLESLWAIIVSMLSQPFVVKDEREPQVQNRRLRMPSILSRGSNRISALPEAPDRTWLHVLALAFRPLVSLVRRGPEGFPKIDPHIPLNISALYLFRSERVHDAGLLEGSRPLQAALALPAVLAPSPVAAPGELEGHP
jgi:hypothetical protein